MKPRLQIATTDYEGDDFPEAESYPSFVADAVTALLRENGIEAEVAVDGGALATRVFAYGSLAEDAHVSLIEEIEGFVEVDWWEQFCDYGYKKYEVPRHYALAPAGTEDLYAAGYDGNKFETGDEAAAAIEGLRAVGPEYDHGWDVVAVFSDRVERYRC